MSASKELLQKFRRSLRDKEIHILKNQIRWGSIHSRRQIDNTMLEVEFSSQISASSYHESGVGEERKDKEKMLLQMSELVQLRGQEELDVVFHFNIQQRLENYTKRILKILKVVQLWMIGSLNLQQIEENLSLECLEQLIGCYEYAQRNNRDSIFKNNCLLVFSHVFHALYLFIGSKKESFTNLIIFWRRVENIFLNLVDRSSNLQISRVQQLCFQNFVANKIHLLWSYNLLNDKILRKNLKYIKLGMDMGIARYQSPLELEYLRLSNVESLLRAFFTIDCNVPAGDYEITLPRLWRFIVSSIIRIQQQKTEGTSDWLKCMSVIFLLAEMLLRWLNFDLARNGDEIGAEIVQSINQIFTAFLSRSVKTITNIQKTTSNEKYLQNVQQSILFFLDGAEFIPLHQLPVNCRGFCKFVIFQREESPCEELQLLALKTFKRLCGQVKNDDRDLQRFYLQRKERSKACQNYFWAEIYGK